MGDDERHDDAAADEATDAAPAATDQVAAADAADASEVQSPARPTEQQSGEDETTDRLREQLGEMREEADRIGELGTGTEQVEAAERFAEAAGRLDEQIGAAARDADDDRS